MKFCWNCKHAKVPESKEEWYCEKKQEFTKATWTCEKFEIYISPEE